MSISVNNSTEFRLLRFRGIITTLLFVQIYTFARGLWRKVSLKKHDNIFAKSLILYENVPFAILLINTFSHLELKEKHLA